MTNTIMVLYQQSVERVFSGVKRVQVDNWIWELDMRGKLLWDYALGTELQPFFKKLVRQEGKKWCVQSWDLQHCIDFLHANTIYWDIHEGMIYVNVRRLSTFFRIHKARKLIEWSCGNVGNLLLYDRTGKQVRSLFIGAHEVTKVDVNRFVLFDNNCDTDQPPCRPGPARLLQIDVNPQHRTAHLTFVYPFGPASLYMGSVQKLPSGSFFGHHSPSLTSVEVSRTGVVQQRIVLQPDPTGASSLLTSYRAQRFYRTPLVGHLRLSETGIRFVTWNCFHFPYPTSGRAYVYLSQADAEDLGVDFRVMLRAARGLPPLVLWNWAAFSYRPYWLPTHVSVELPRGPLVSPATIPAVYLEVLNNEGVHTVLYVALGGRANASATAPASPVPRPGLSLRAVVN